MTHHKLLVLIACLLTVTGFLSVPYGRAQGNSTAWQVEVDPLSEPLKAFRAVLKESNAKVQVDGIGFNIQRKEQVNATLVEKQEIIARWQGILVRELKSKDFVVLSDDRLQRGSGLTIERMRELMIKAQPYGDQDTAAARLGKSLFFLINEDASPCRGTGAMAALVPAYYPPDKIQSDYGSIAVFLMGVGDCGRPRSINWDYMERLTRHLERTFPGKVGR
jgi:hypothetical protein